MIHSSVCQRFTNTWQYVKNMFSGKSEKDRGEQNRKNWSPEASYFTAVYGHCQSGPVDANSHGLHLSQDKAALLLHAPLPITDYSLIQRCAPTGPSGVYMKGHRWDSKASHSDVIPPRKWRHPSLSIQSIHSMAPIGLWAYNVWGETQGRLTYWWGGQTLRILLSSWLVCNQQGKAK